MSDILVSIIESIADAAATAKARRAEALAAMRPAAPVPRALVRRFMQAPVPQQEREMEPMPADPAPPPAEPLVLLAPAHPPARHLSIRSLFAGPDSLIRTVVAAEILGPPLAMRRQNLWDSPGV